MKTIVKYEMEKIQQNRTFIGALVISLFVLAGILYIGMYHAQLQGIERKGVENYHQIVERSTGEFTDQRVQDVLSNYIGRFQQDDVNNRGFDLFSWEVANTFIANGENIYDRMNTAVKQGETLTIDQIKVKSIEEIGFTEFEKPLKMGSFVTWKDFYHVTNQLFLLISTLSILLCSLVFSSDTSRNMNPLLLSTRRGRKQMTVAKIIAGTFISVLAFLFIHGVSLGAFALYNSGFTGWDTSIQTNFSMELFTFPVELNQLQVYGLAVALQLIGLLAIVGITLYISSATRSPFSALLIALGIFLLPKALTQLVKRGPIYHLLNLFPINNYAVQDFLTLMSTKTEFFLTYFMQNMVLTMVVLVAIALLCNWAVYQRLKQYQEA
ncbi:hypothetical protein NCCP2716_14590 [Sporosarcina sp. NCCP-2716]|uniref:ABC transporter permease subunit n=1 Tax=Sporosarcina sp. NCCP-2716 TaxID=2943679 RepID=UPI00203DB8F7|nr:ABC transporter permease subunit [Sporosarcina sp. NCCP-2716]GKV68961.1 hypothetical protein NCCP2716_14590 [Sporosarcina sp. NCCP-2716]